MNVQAIKAKLQAKKPVSPQEMAHGILNDRFLLFNFLMDNNLADVNQALRLNLNNDFLPFAPSRPAIEQVIKAYIEKNDVAALNTLLREFDYNPNANNYTTNPELKKQLKFLK